MKTSLKAAAIAAVLGLSLFSVPALADGRSGDGGDHGYASRDRDDGQFSGERGEHRHFGGHGGRHGGCGGHNHRGHDGHDRRGDDSGRGDRR